MGCQKSLQLITGVKTQQAPELRFAQRTLLIRTDGIFFEDVTGDIVPIHLPHLLGDIIRNMYWTLAFLTVSRRLTQKTLQDRKIITHFGGLLAGYLQ
jgi:hypothetical protein